MNNLVLNKTIEGSVEICINVQPSNKWVQFVLCFMGVISFVVPITVMLIPQLQIGIGFIITLIIFVGSSIFFFRKLLWNRFGAEKFNISRNTLVHYYDYKYFKDSVIKREFTKIEVGYYEFDNENIKINKVTTAGNDEFMCYLYLLLDDFEIKTIIPISSRNIALLSEYIKDIND